MKLEEMFKYCTDQEMAVEMIDKLNKTNMIKGIKYTDLKYSIRDALGCHIFYNVWGVIDKLVEHGYVKSKKFNEKDFEEDKKLHNFTHRYHLTRKGRKLYKEICWK